MSLDTPDRPSSPRVDLEVHARQTKNTYAQPVGQPIPNAPMDNPAKQLADVLQSLNPALRQVTASYVNERDKELAAEAFVAAQKAQAKNVSDLKEAQRQGLIKNGAAPNFIRAWKSNVLKLSAEKAGAQLQEIYFSNDAVRNSDDPAAFDKFVSEWRSRFDTNVLHNGIPNGPPGFTAIEIHNSGYYDQLDQTVRALRAEHLRHRVAERERQATETVSNLVLQRLDSAFDTAVDTPNLKAVAQSINDAFYHPLTGQVQYGGLQPSKANEILTEAIITKAISAGDASILEVASFLGPNEKATLANTKVFREKAEAARQHISNARWMDEERARKRAEYRGLGVENPEQVEQRAREERARIEEQYANEKLHRDQYAKQLQKHEAVEPEVKAIIKLHALNGDTTSSEIRDHLKAIAGIDSDTYRSLTTWLQHEARQGKAVDEQAALREFTRMRASISDNPTKFDSREIIKAANRGLLNAGQVDQLFDLVDTAKKQAREFPVMSAPLINDMRSALKGAVLQNPMDEFGEGRLRANRAAAELNSLIAGYLRSHPKATEYELYEKLSPMVEQIARKHSPDLDQTLRSQEAARDPRRTELEAQLKERYPNKAQRDQIINQLLSRK